MVEVPGISLHLVAEGAGSPLVFLHGFPLSQIMWDAQRREFRETHRVLIPDLRGFGRSIFTDDPQPHEKVTMDQYADDVVALLDAIGVTEPVTMCGLSMGGYIAMALLRRHPHRVNRLVLCDTKATADTAEAAENRRTTAEKVLRDGARIVADAMLPKLFGPGTNEQQPDVVDTVRNVILASSSRGIAAAQRGMAERIDSTDSLRELAIPTLLIVGESDAISTPDEMRQMAEVIPGAQLAVIPKAGHMSPMEAPEEFNRILRDWLTATA